MPARARTWKGSLTEGNSTVFGSSTAIDLSSGIVGNVAIEAFRVTCAGFG
jgi:hypothetical protein